MQSEYLSLKEVFIGMQDLQRKKGKSVLQKKEDDVIAQNLCPTIYYHGKEALKEQRERESRKWKVCLGVWWCQCITGEEYISISRKILHNSLSTLDMEWRHKNKHSLSDALWHIPLRTSVGSFKKDPLLRCYVTQLWFKAHWDWTATTLVKLRFSRILICSKMGKKSFL